MQSDPVQMGLGGEGKSRASCMGGRVRNSLQCGWQALLASERLGTLISS